ncbi:hypothetical protein DYB32_000640 [Aphanomyces invadans]|uniref:Uncharacterized protein n=1 Tax=Aphanomyces invadans TaxID=157072 RepID=A0A3R6VTP4_9STRA|nr:hypothetical protein DYB32_000640 [Aphanomyces invadans]
MSIQLCRSKDAKQCVVQVGPLTGSLDATQRVTTVALRAFAELKRAHVAFSDWIEPWISFAWAVDVPSPTPRSVRSTPTIVSSLEVHGKVTNVSILVVPRSAVDADDPSWHCPPLEIRVDDISASSLPQDSLNVRSCAELRLSRVSVRVVCPDSSATSSAVTLDYMRLFLFPSASILNSSCDDPAEIELEGEWLEVQYSPQLLHALGGVAHVVLFTCRAPLTRVFALPKAREATPAVPPQRSLDDMFRKEPVYPRVKFQGLVKRIVASFPVALTAHAAPTMEQVSVDSWTIDTDATSARFRVRMQQIKVGQRTRVKLKPYLVVGHFAVEETPVGASAVVDLYGENVAATWDVLSQIRVLKVVQDVTAAVYRMLFQVFHSYTLHVAPPHSKFRAFAGGVNPSMDDMAAYTAMVAHLQASISSSGDKLHRLLIHNVAISAPALQLDVAVGVFGGSDLPNLWNFASIQVTWRTDPVVSAASVFVRRTVGSRMDHVFGEYEALLRQRQKVLEVDYPSPLSEAPEETLCVSLSQLRVVIPYACLERIAAVAALVQTQLATLATILAQTMSAFWRPLQQNPHFFRYFLKPPRPSNPKIVLDVRQVEVAWIDDPMEGWLEQVAPIWMSTLVEQEGRRQILNDQWTALQATNPDPAATTAWFESKQDELAQTIAASYIRRCQQIQSSRQPTTTRLTVVLSHIHGWVHPIVDHVQLIRRMKQVDPDTHALLQQPHCVRPCFDLLVGVSLHVTVDTVHVQVRGPQSSPPPLRVDQVAVKGDVIVGQPTSTPAFQASQRIELPEFQHLQVTVSTIPVKVFHDVEITVVGAAVSYSPLLHPSLVGLALDAQQCLPFVLPALELRTSPYWDILRRLVHGRATVRCRDTTVRLTSQDAGEFILVTVHTVDAAYTKGAVRVDVERVQCKIEPHGVGTILQVPKLSMAIALSWGEDGVPASHYVYPVKFSFLDANQAVQVHIQDPPAAATNPSKLSVAVQLTVGTNERKDTTSVVVYGSTVAWLLEFGQWYMHKLSIPPVSARQRRRGMPPVDRAVRLADLAHHMHRLVVESVQVEHGIDLVVYHSDSSPIGVRVLVKDVFASLAMSYGIVRSLSDCFDHHMVAVDPTHCDWAIHDVVANVQEIQLRVCTVKSGSRGVAFVMLHQSYAVMEPSRTIPPWDDKAKTIREQFHAIPMEFEASGDDGREGADTSRPVEAKSILEHFDIKDDVHLLKQHAPPPPPPSTPAKDKCMPRRLSTPRPPSTMKSDAAPPELGCLCCVLVHQPRILLTLDTIEALVEIALEWWEFLQAQVPSLSDIPVAVVREVEATLAVPVDEANKAPTSHLEHMLVHSPVPKVRVSSTHDLSAQLRAADEHAPADAVHAPTAVIQTLLRIKVLDFQLAVQDTANKGSLLIAIPSGCVEPAVDLEHKSEHVDVSVTGVYLYTSSLEVDVRTHHWLKPDADAYSKASTMVWKQVLQASAIDGAIAITHDVPKLHEVDVHMARIQVMVDVECKQILLDMGTLFAARILDKREKHKAAVDCHQRPPPRADSSDALLASTAPEARSSDVVAMLPQLWHKRRALGWTMTALRYQESCRVGVLSCEQPVQDNVQTYRRWLPTRQTAPPAVGPSAAHANLMSLAREVAVLSVEINCAFAEYKKHKQVHPTVDLQFDLEAASVLVKGTTFDLLRVETYGVECSLSQFEDQSGTLSITIHALSAVNLMPQTPLPDLIVPVDRKPAEFVDAGGIVRVDAEMAAPVADQPVVQHFEVNVLPLQVCITYELILQLYAFATTQAPHLDKQEEKVRSQFLQYTAKSSKKVARLSHAGGDSACAGHVDDADVVATKEAESPTHPDHRPPMQSTATNLVTFKHIRLGTILVLLTYKSGKATGGAVMLPQHLEEMRGFELKLHSLVYTDKTCTVSDLVLRVRRDILLDVLSQVGRNFNNIGVFLKERLDISRWAGFELNNPLKSLSMSSGVRESDGPSPPSPLAKTSEVFSLELKPEKSANPIKKAKSRFGFFRMKKKDKRAEILAAEVCEKDVDE